MVRYGANVVGTGLVAVGRVWAETGIITAGLGVRDLGYWSIAQRLVETATDLSGSAILPVSTVAFAKVNSSRLRLHGAHLKATAVAQTVVTPLMIAIVVSSSVLVPFLFGSGWGTSATVAGPLAIAAALSFGTSVDRGLLDGAGQPGRWFLFSLVIAGVSIGLTALSAQHSVLLVAYAYVVTASVETLGRWILMSRFLEVSVAATARPFLMVAPSAACSVLVGLLSMWALRSTPTLVELAVTGIAVVASHAAMTRLVTPGVWAQIVALLPLRHRRSIS